MSDHMNHLTKARIEIPKDLVTAFCQRNKICRLAIFGSVLRDDFTLGSDVDVLVEFEPDARVGFLALAKMETELGDILDRKVDICTFGGVRNNPNWLLREEILGSAETVYVKAR